MSGTFTANGQLDPSRPIIVSCLGKKRSGKSKMARLLFDGFPGDRMVIDVNGTDGPVNDVIDITGTVDTLPDRWPERLRDDKKPMTLRFVPDAGSPTFVEDMDAMMGIAWRHQDVCILVHEMGLLAPAGKTPANTRRILQSNRHRRVNLIACAPRPITMDPLVLMQSDLVYVFALPNDADRKRVAENIGWPAPEFERAVIGVKGDPDWPGLRTHEYLRFDANEDPPENDTDPDMRLVHFAPLPADVVAEIDRDRPGQ